MLGKFLQKTVNLGWWGVFELVPPPEPPDVGLCWAGMSLGRGVGDVLVVTDRKSVV